MGNIGHNQRQHFIDGRVREVYGRDMGVDQMIEDLAREGRDLNTS
jgi:hypothetical protein